MGKFVIEKTDAGFHFNLVADNGQVVCTSQVYTSLDSCKNGIESVKTNAKAPVEDQTVDGFEALSAPKFEIYSDAADSFRFRLIAANGQNIAASQAYTTKQSAQGGIDSIGENAPKAEIVEE